MVLAVLSGGAHARLHRDVFATDRPSFTRLERGEQAEERPALHGARWTPAPKALFLTYDMAEGINLQRAQALGLIDVISNVRNMIQGLGRMIGSTARTARSATTPSSSPG